MKYLLQVDFKMDGPFGDEMSKGFANLAESINNESGVIWKIWTEDAAARKLVEYTYLKRKRMLKSI